ncbi:hypothetical protein U1Q18_027245 [Sarracenia purpurea var. burkii]
MKIWFPFSFCSIEDQNLVRSKIWNCKPDPFWISSRKSISRAEAESQTKMKIDLGENCKPDPTGVRLQRLKAATAKKRRWRKDGGAATGGKERQWRNDGW